MKINSYLNFSISQIIFIFLFLSLSSFAAIINVPNDYSTIQAAIDASVDGDDIVVSPRVYYENIQFNGKNIILRSKDPNNTYIVEHTVIDGCQNESVVRFSGTETKDCVISGFTITNGKEIRMGGGGISGGQTLATIENNVIKGNYAYGNSFGWGGGGIYRCHGLIHNNIIEYNEVKSNTQGCGGGICDCDGTIQNNVISYNIIDTDKSSGSGGGVSSCDGTIENNVISYNLIKGSAGGDGGGVSDCCGTIKNNYIVDNSIETNSFGRGGGIESCNGRVQNNFISGNMINGTSAMGAGVCNLTGLVQGNLVVNNVANGTEYSQGGGIYFCNGIIQYNTIVGNSAIGGDPQGGGIYECNGIVVNCILWGNSIVNDTTEYNQIYNCNNIIYSCVQDYIGGISNISSDPKFKDPSNLDYHLQSNSHCINSGTMNYLFNGSNTDIDGESRFF